MSVYVPGSVFSGPVTGFDMTLGRHEANFAAANTQLAALGDAAVAAAAADSAIYEGCRARTFQSGMNARAAHLAGDVHMVAATQIADNSNYRTLFSPSSAYGPVGPLGATAGITSPYVSGHLHQR